MTSPGAHARSLALVRVALTRATLRTPRSRPRPDAEGAPVDAPRTPTLAGGAAAALDA